MASIGRMRSQKRSSSSSYTSTVTTLAVIAFCVLGLWMLTSDYMVPSQVTSRKHSDSQGNLATTTAKIEDRPTNTNTKKSDSYEDNPGDLPDDDLTADDPLKQGLKKGNGIKDGDKQEKVGKLEDKDTHGLDGKESAEQHQKQNELQVSEESSFTQNEESVDHRDPENAVANGKTEVLNVDQQDQSAITEEANNSEETKNGVKNSETITNVLQEEQNQTTQTFSDETKKDQTAKPESEDMTSKDDTQHGVTVPHETKTVSEEMPEGNSTATTQDTKLDTAIVLPNSGIPKESNESKASWSTQASESNKEKERHKVEDEKSEGNPYGYTWQLCNVTAGQDYIPCLDNAIALKKLHTTKHFEHRERHCPDESPTCLAPLPLLYKRPIPWPESRTKIWFHNVPHPGLAKVKGHQNWVKVTGEFLTFPGGGTQFIHGALLYIDFIEKAVPNIAWGRHTRVVLDVGCGVASFGGFLFDRNVLTMSFAPKDEHEAQVQFALERGIPAISAVMGSQRLPFPSRVFDLVHCARCRVPWHVEGGRLLLELNRMLRPGGYFVWSATPVYQKLPEDIEIWEAMSNLTKSMCWKLETIQKNQINKIAAAIFRKPTKNDCYKQREQATPPMCKRDDDPNAAWYVPLQSCMHLVPVEEYARGSKWPAKWPNRLKTPPYWLNKTQMGIYGKPAPEDFIADYEHWKYVVNNTYLSSLGISWSNVRNVMDMRAVYGGFAAALKDLKVWVMNVVNVNAPDTLPIIFERGLFGIYHDWCESFSTYPRSYDLLHADHLFSQLKTRCNLASVLAEVDRIVRPGGNLIVRDVSNVVGEVENLLKSLHWEVHLTFTKDQEGILSATKSDWRPEEYAPPF